MHDNHSHTHYSQLDGPGDGEQPAAERIVRDRDAKALDEPQLRLLHPHIRQRVRLSEAEQKPSMAVRVQSHLRHIVCLSSPPDT